jgi:hypothetical protein
VQALDNILRDGPAPSELASDGLRDAVRRRLGLDLDGDSIEGTVSASAEAPTTAPVPAHAPEAAGEVAEEAALELDAEGLPAFDLAAVTVQRHG